MGCLEECVQKRLIFIVVHLAYSVDTDISLLAFSIDNLSKDR